MSLTEAAQAVQYSGFPDAYAKWEPQATTLVTRTSGADVVALGCGAGAREPTAAHPNRPAPAGTDEAEPALTRCSPPRRPSSAGSLSLPCPMTASPAPSTSRCPTPDPAAAGRALAAWAVAHGTGMQISQVDVQDRQWADHEWVSTTPIDDPAQVRITVEP